MCLITMAKYWLLTSLLTFPARHECSTHNLRVWSKCYVHFSALPKQEGVLRNLHADREDAGRKSLNVGVVEIVGQELRALIRELDGTSLSFLPIHFQSGLAEVRFASEIVAVGEDSAFAGSDQKSDRIVLIETEVEPSRRWLQRQLCRGHGAEFLE